MVSLNARKNAALACSLVLLAAFSPAWPDAVASRDSAAETAGTADAERIPSQVASLRIEPERSVAAKVAGDAPWGEAGSPAQGHAEAALYGIPMPWGQERFESYRTAYLTEDGKKWLAAIMARAKPYLPYVAERIRYYGLPDELAFLPVIESEYSARNVSRSGATGLWQFMRNSIRGYGMQVDEWVDERRDFMKSTDGALRKLSDNYSTFGDWNLALAAYNCGDGAIARALAKAKKAGVSSPDYWELRKDGYLKSETAGYVPKFLAVASILRYPGRYGLAQDWDEAIAWETIAPGRPVDIKLIADEIGIPFTVLRDANPELRYTVTPPTASYALKVPAAAADAVRALVSDKSRKLIRYYLHTVRSGDTLTAIAQRYGTPMQTIVSSNPGLRPDHIGLGQVIVVPALKDAPAPAAPKAEADQAPEFTGSYSVAKGDTLWSIALRYDVQPESLAERNGLGLSSVIREGMSLRVPTLKATP
jgi:membrane-bound lytic murein transglycosylase D